MPDQFDIFTPESVLDDWNGRVVRITNGRFELDTTYSRWQWKFTGVDNEGDEYESLGYNLGDKFKSYDGGETVEHENGAKGKLRSSSSYMFFITNAMQTDAASELRRRNEELYDLHGPLHGEFFDGLEFEIGLVGQPGQTKNDLDEWVDTTWDRAVPVRYVGSSEETAPGPAGATASSSLAPEAAPSTPSASPSPGGAASVGVAVGGLSVTDLAKVTELANTHSYEKFIDEVMVLQLEDGNDMVANTEALAALSDESWYLSLRAV